MPAPSLLAAWTLGSFDAVGCVVAPAACVRIPEVDPAGAGFLEDAFDFIKDLAQVFDVEVECWFQAELSFPGGTFMTETGWLPLVTVLDGG